MTESIPEAEHYGPFIGFVAIHNGSKPMIWLAKNVLKRRHVRIIVGERLSHMLVHFQNALGTVLFEYPDRFRAVLKVLQNAGSFPIIMDLGDYESCAKDNYKMPLQDGFVMKSLPVMTMCHTTANCSHYFPMPAYATYDYKTILKNNTWDATFKNWANAFPAMQDKIPKAFWRGSCPRGQFRYRFINQAQRHIYRNFMDVAPTNGRFCGRRAGFTLPEESMRYRAVLDIDGNAWSERFPRLLCYNSVVIKVNVDPDFEEYFMPTLTPGVHYVPASMENFTEVAKWAVQDSSLDEINRIVKNANDWCKRRIESRVLHYDFLTVLNGIVEGLNVNDPTWVDRWRMEQNSYLGTDLIDAHGGFVFQLRDEPPSEKALRKRLPIVQGLIVTKLPVVEVSEPKKG